MDALLQALLNTGGMPHMTMGPTASGAPGEAFPGLMPSMDQVQVQGWTGGTSLLGQILRHELAHILQSRTQGLGNPNPVDTAVRKQAGAPPIAPPEQRQLNEDFAQFTEGRKDPGLTMDPLLFMILRAMSSNMFSQGLQGQQPQQGQR